MKPDVMILCPGYLAELQRFQRASSGDMAHVAALNSRMLDLLADCCSEELRELAASMQRQNPDELDLEYVAKLTASLSV